MSHRWLIIPLVLLGLSSPILADDPLHRMTVPGRWMAPILPEDLPKLTYPDYEKDSPLDRARIEAFAGRNRLSLMTLSTVPATADPKVVAMLKATNLIALDRDQEAIDALNGIDDPHAQIMHASALTHMGKLDEAIAVLNDHLKAHPDSIAGHFAMGQVHEKLGDIAAALKDYEWFVKGPGNLFEKWQNQQERGFDDPADVVTIGRAVDRWASMTNAYKDSPQLDDAILNIFVKAYDVIDRGYWPAHVAAAEYFHSHDNETAAQTELQLAARGNPHDVRALTLLAKIALAEFNFDKCDSVVATIREFSPDSVDADLLETRNLLLQRTPADAARPIARVIAKQPKNIEALGLLASVDALQLHDDKTAEVLKQVDAIAPRDATAYAEVADQLGAMRQYPRSADMYKIAIERAPWWTMPRNGLGLLYTQSGDEDLARSTLEAAHDLDPYNLRTTNYLRLLDDLGKFAKSESAHFIVYYDADADPLIPVYFGDYLESAYSAVTSDFKHEPAVKTFIEVFPTHDAFSVRTTGSPWIGTVGASTGRVIALVSPRKGEMTMGTFNWSQVLRHEFTHTVTLSMTDNRIPHWFTEGLAVWEEHQPLRWEWVPMLYQAVNKDELFTMENLTWGFVRPRRPIDRQLAYAQSYWICTYIEEKYGHDAILKMLEDYRTGMSQDEVFPKTIHRTLAEFQDEFKAWTKQQVASWGYDEETSKKYKDLREKGEQLIAGKQYADAVKVWEEIAAMRPVDELPHQRLAGLYLSKSQHNVDKAIEQLAALDAVELKDDRYAKRIARLYRDENRLPEAIKSATRAVYTDPYDLDGHQLLAELYEKSGDEKNLARENQVIPVLQQWIEKQRKQSEIPADGN